MDPESCGTFGFVVYYADSMAHRCLAVLPRREPSGSASPKGLGTTAANSTHGKNWNENGGGQKKNTKRRKLENLYFSWGLTGGSYFGDWMLDCNAPA